MSLEYNEKNITLAKNLRKNATPQENHLWYDFLAKYEVRFQRQKAIDNKSLPPRGRGNALAVEGACVT